MLLTSAVFVHMLLSLTHLRKKRERIMLITSYQTGASVLYLLLHILRFFSFVTQRRFALLVFDVVDEQLAGKLHDRDR